MSNGIRYDPLLASHIVRELERRLGESEARGVHFDPDSRTFFLFLSEATLVGELHPLRGLLRLQPRWEPPEEATPLRGRLRELRVPADDRIIHLRIGDRIPRHTLVLELMTNQWNALLLKEPEEVIEEVLWARSPGGRELRGGRRYEPPPPSERAGIVEPVSREAWIDLLAPVPPPERVPVLLRNVAYTSRINARAILGEAGGEEAADDEEALVRARERWLALRDRETADPRILRPDERPQPYPFSLPGVEDEEASSLLDAMDRCARARSDEGGAGLPGVVVDRLEEEMEAARTKRIRLEEELERADDPAGIRRKGDLLLARLEGVSRGARSVELEGFDGETVELTLDPSLPPAENADRFYREAARAERARKRLPRLIADARSREETLEEALDAAREGTLDLARARELLPERRDEDGDAGEEGRSLPYRRYLTSGGNEVRVGRGARQNEDLTFHHSRPDDVWLHARHAAGAHVILRWDRDDRPPERELAEAGVLAALHSEARHSGTVPIDWTRRKYVRSPRKSPPGAVIPDRVKTVFVEPDPAVEKRMAAAWARSRRSP